MIFDISQRSVLSQAYARRKFCLAVAHSQAAFSFDHSDL